MVELSERADKICERVMKVLEDRVFDDEVQQDLRGLLQSLQVLGELLKLQSSEASPHLVRVIMEGGTEELGG